MKILDKVKRKAERQKLKKIKKQYKQYTFGDVIYDAMHEKYLILLKKEWNKQFYIIVQNQYGKMFLHRFVCDTNVSIEHVAKNGREYILNSKLFDSWFKEAEEKIHVNSEYYYSSLKPGFGTDEFKNKKYRLAIKKEHANKYYLVLKSEDNQYVVAKLIWFGDFRAVVLSQEELNQNRRLFTSWINEAKLYNE